MSIAALFPGQRVQSDQIGPDMDPAACAPVDFPNEEASPDAWNRVKAELGAALAVAPLAVITWTITAAPTAVIVAALGLVDPTKVSIVRNSAGVATITFDPTSGIFVRGAMSHSNTDTVSVTSTSFTPPSSTVHVIASADGSFTTVVW